MKGKPIPQRVNDLREAMRHNFKLLTVLIVTWVALEHHNPWRAFNPEDIWWYVSIASVAAVCLWFWYIGINPFRPPSAIQRWSDSIASDERAGGLFWWWLGRLIVAWIFFIIGSGISKNAIVLMNGVAWAAQTEAYQGPVMGIFHPLWFPEETRVSSRAGTRSPYSWGIIVELGQTELEINIPRSQWLVLGKRPGARYAIIPVGEGRFGLGIYRYEDVEVRDYQGTRSNQGPGGNTRTSH